MINDNFLGLPEKEWRDFVRFVVCVVILCVLGLLGTGALIAYAVGG